MINVIVIGAAGRMGKTHVRLVCEDKELNLVGATEYAQCPLLGEDAGTVAGIAACGVSITADIAPLLATADAIIDFSSPKCTIELAKQTAQQGVAHVIGTTGLSDDDKEILADLGSKGAKIVQAPNMSIGVNLLFALCAKVAPLLGDDYDIEVIEMHHNQKKDAPSGTAERLGQILAESTGRDYNKDTRHGRVGMVGARTKKEIGMHALRGGDVVGDHTVMFSTDGERVELTHKASSRETFAKGSLRAIKFLANANAGIYDMQDVLGLKK